MESYSKLKSGLVSIVAMVLLALFVLVSALLYHQTQKERHLKESATIARVISVNLEDDIRHVSRILQTLGQIESGKSFKKEIYDQTAKSLVAAFPEFFYALNFVNPQGTIERVYPVEQNAQALGKNLLEREDLRAYVQSSLETKKAYMSHRVMTYQGVHAIIVYQPILGENQIVKGWLNAVISTDNWLKSQIAALGNENVALSMEWEGHNETLVIGAPEKTQTFSYSFPVMNQLIHLKVGFRPSGLDARHENLLLLMDVIGFGLLLLLAFLFYQLVSSRQKLVETNRQLSLKNILLNSLAHDVSSPLSSLSIFLEQINRKPDQITDA